MQPRVLFRTHYQAAEPALLELLVKRCTSATKSAYPEMVAERLATEVRRLGKRFNVPASGYALDLGRSLGLLNEQNAWTDKGHLLNLTAEILDGGWDDQLPLNMSERLVHLRLFLEADGAALLYIAHYLLKHRTIPNSDADWNALAKDLFSEIYTECLRLAGTTTDRVALRTEIDRIRSRGYKGNSGLHKMIVHVQTLYRLGLVDRPTSGRLYILRDENQGLHRLVNEVRDLYALEEIIKDRRTVEVSAKILRLAEDQQYRTFEPDEFLRLIAPVYRNVMSTGIPLAPLTTLIEAVQVHLLTSFGQMLSYKDAQELLQAAQRGHRTKVRFHVDRRGAPAFLKLSDELVRR